jgi:N-acyl-D-glutamate deacylase
MHSLLKVFLILNILMAVCFTSMLSFASDTYDIVLTSGRVIDPETNFDGIRNIGINNGTIVKIATKPLSGKLIINARDHVISPGFIDLHHHGQNISGYRMQAIQGVTTALELESGILPIGDWYSGQTKKGLPINYGAAAAWTFARIAAFNNEEPKSTLEYFQEAQSQHDWKMEISSEQQLETLLQQVEQGLKEGGLGIGINAGYAPGYGQKEYYALAKLAAKYGTPTYTHVRYASNSEPQSSFEAIKELIANALLTGADMHLCHINSSSLRDINATMELFEQAKAKGVTVTAGAYPWGAASTVAGAAMFSGEGWKEKTGYQSGSVQYGKERLSDKDYAALQKSNPGNIITWHFLDESKPAELNLLDKSVAHPNVLIESDAMPWMVVNDGNIEDYTGDEWPLPDNVIAHPRSSGTFVKVLQEYVRERGLISLPDAINKMSYMPADLLDDSIPQMKKKGRLQEGMDADIVIFNPKTITNRATYDQPTNTPIGVHSVIVNGQLVVKNGVLIENTKAGIAIRRDNM